MEQKQYRTYVDGNTVRKVEDCRITADRKNEADGRNRERNRQIAKRNQAKSMRMS